LLERCEGCQRQRNANRADQFVGGRNGFTVASKKLSQIDNALASSGTQHQLCFKCQQGGRRVTDRRSGAYIATDGGCVSDEPGSELGKETPQQWDGATQFTFQLGQCMRRTKLNTFVGVS